MFRVGQKSESHLFRSYVVNKYARKKRQTEGVDEAGTALWPRILYSKH